MKVCVFGAGAIGGYLAVELARAGVDVSVVLAAVIWLRFVSLASGC